MFRVTYSSFYSLESFSSSQKLRNSKGLVILEGGNALIRPGEP